MEETFLCISVYYPNSTDEKLKMKSHVHKIIKDFYQDEMNVIIGGDFNCVLNPKLDNLAGCCHPKKEIISFNNTLQECQLQDIWRCHNEDQKEHTWRHKSLPIMRRIDYILGNDKLLQKTVQCSILDIPLTDHRAVHSEIVTETVKQYSGYWKFNNELLKDDNYLKLMTTVIEQSIGESNITSHQIVWDYCKQNIKEASIAYGKQRARCKIEATENLKKSLKNIKAKLSQDPANEHLQNQTNQLELKLNIESISVAKGAQVRSKQKWIEEGERNTQYFLTLEKIRGQQKIMSELKTDDEVITNQDEILKEQVKFYSTLYKKDTRFNQNDLELFLNNTILNKIDNTNMNKLEKDIDESEVYAALKDMNNNASPGNDGLTAAWYKTFWTQIKQILIKSYKESFEKG